MAYQQAADHSLEDGITPKIISGRIDHTDLSVTFQ